MNEAPRFARTAIAAGALLALATASHATELLNDGDVKLRWDNTLKYSTAWRVKSPSNALTSEPNQDDGDRNFRKGLISNRVDWLSEADLTWRNFAFRVSGAAWYDTAYHGGTDNDSPLTFNPVSVPPGNLPDAVQKLHGSQAELLDALALVTFNLGDRPGVLRAGKHTVVFGETLFYGGNGIAAAQAPVDAIKALSVPNTQFKELLMPVDQISGQLQLTPNWTAQAYYQLEWRRTRLPGAGSYLSTVDFLDAGGERILTGPPLIPGARGAALYRAPDVTPGNSGQGGLAMRWRPDNHDIEYGFYAVRYHDKTPQLYVVPGAAIDPPIGRVGWYQLVYPQGIRAFGASFSTLIGDANVAGELSLRRNAPLVSDAQPMPALGFFDNSGAAGYAVGNTAHLNLSAIYAWQKSAWFDNATFTTEIGANQVQSVTKNAAALDPNTSRDAWGFRFIFEPNYYQLFSGMDISIPVGVGYSPAGRSGAVGAFGVDKGGDVSVGVKGTYLGKFKLSLNYTHYFGPEGTTLIPVGPGYVFSFKQAQKDRDFVTFSAQYAF